MADICRMKADSISVASILLKKCLIGRRNQPIKRKPELIGISTIETMSKDEIAKRYPHLAIVDLDVEKLWQIKNSGS